MRGSDRLQPYGLPDSGDRRIPDSLRVGHLLSTGLVAFIARVPYTHHQLMRTFAIQIGSDIQGKRGKASRVGTDQDIIHEHVRFPIHGAEVQQDIFSFP